MAESRKIRGTVLAIVMTGAGALLAGCGGDYDYTPVANTSPDFPTSTMPPSGGEKVVKCAVSPVLKLDPPVTAVGSKEFKVTLLAGTATCIDDRGATDRVIGATYGEQQLADGSGTCADFKIAKPELKLTWILAGGKSPQDGKISADDFAISGINPPIQPPKVTVTGGPLDGATTDVDSPDPAYISYLPDEDCMTSGVSMLASAVVIKFTPTS